MIQTARNEVTATQATQAIKLIIDPLSDQPDHLAASDTNQLDDERYISTLDVPDGRSFLFMPPGQTPRIETSIDDASNSSNGSKVFSLEPFRQDHQFFLMLVSPIGEQVMVNGSPAPSPAILTEGDQIRMPQGDVVLHVTHFLKPYVGAPTTEMLAAETACSLCRLPLVENTQVYACPFCGGVTHLETQKHKGGDKPLQCAASTSTCPNCSKSIVKGEGLTYVPREVLKAVQHG